MLDRDPRIYKLGTVSSIPSLNLVQTRLSFTHFTQTLNLYSLCLLTITTPTLLLSLPSCNNHYPSVPTLRLSLKSPMGRRPFNSLMCIVINMHGVLGLFLCPSDAGNVPYRVPPDSFVPLRVYPPSDNLLQTTHSELQAHLPSSLPDSKTYSPLQLSTSALVS